MLEGSLFDTFYNAFTTFLVPLNLVFHLSVFIGAFVLVLKNEKLPQWHIAPLWWSGMASGLCALSILIQFIFGWSFPLSYYNVGSVLETCLHGSLAILASTFLLSTYKQCKKPRQPSRRVRKSKA